MGRRKLPTDGPLDRNHKIMAVTIGAVFGFILGLTSVGSGVFFGMALVTVFPLSTRRVVGTDLFHAMMVTMAAAAGTIIWGTPDFGYVGAILIGSIPGILIGSHFTARMNQQALRGSIASVLAALRAEAARRVLTAERGDRPRQRGGGPSARAPTRRPYNPPSCPAAAPASSSSPSCSPHPGWRFCAPSS